MNHITCSYCGSRLNQEPNCIDDKVYCSFCDMYVIPSVNGERKERFQKLEFSPADYEFVKLTTPQLMELHTVDLLLLLQFLRDERRNYFSTMRIIKKVAADEEDYKVQEKEAGDQYEMITRKCFVVENILIDRIGYIPRKVTNDMIAGIYQRAEHERNKKLMQIKSS
jgi:hypothetical protein